MTALTTLESVIKEFVSSNSSFKLLDPIPYHGIRGSDDIAPASKIISKGPLCILDSSFNPPHKAHHIIAESALKFYGSQSPSLLLLLATNNADKKGQSIQQFAHRVKMMQLMAEHMMASNKDSPPVYVGLTNEAKFVHKLDAVKDVLQTPSSAQSTSLSSSSPASPSSPSVVFLVGFDTLVRILDSKYYDPNLPLEESLAPLMTRAAFFCLTRQPDPISVPQTNAFSTLDSTESRGVFHGQGDGTALRARGGAGGSGGRGRAAARRGARGGVDGNRGRHRLGLADIRVSLDITVRVSLVPGRTVELGRRRLNVNTTLDQSQRGQLGRAEVTSEVNGTTNRLDLGESENRTQLGVVGNLESSANSAQLRERDVGKLVIRNNSQRTTDLSELGEGKSVDGVVNETSRSIDNSDVGHRDRRNVSESDVVGPLKTGERGGNLLSIERDVQRLSNSLKVDIDLVEISVVVDIKSVNIVNIDTLKRSQGSVGNGDALGLVNNVVELDATKTSQVQPVDSTNRGQLRHCQSTQSRENLQIKSSTNGLKRRSIDRAQVGGIVGNQVTGDLLNTVDVGRRQSRVKSQSTVKSLTTGNAVQIGLLLSSQITGTGRVGGSWNLLVAGFTGAGGAASGGWGSAPDPVARFARCWDRLVWVVDLVVWFSGGSWMIRWLFSWVTYQDLTLSRSHSLKISWSDGLMVW
ncbi:Pof1p [Sugiyamaella lignohabitans]|uniref:Pof1p n=1 Tax=Sugiyamaella lignohabitans TaxID=796027 RepID=A0A161HK04_9ASCO|nr:Pof1p [Sugiyamaella lignohabitans]ANB13187.1 Pof1p [Sugiyamaella lignohabitans]